LIEDRAKAKAKAHLELIVVFIKWIASRFHGTRFLSKNCKKIQNNLSIVIKDGV